MSSLTITTRITQSGPRYVVRYRLGGRAYPIQHGGSFRTLKEAKARRDFIGGELAAGRNPTESLEALLAPKPRRTTAHAFESWKASRLDVDARTLANYDGHWKRLEQAFGKVALDEISFEHVQEWISDNAQGEDKLTPKVLRDYMGTLKQILDFTGIDPNPARAIGASATRPRSSRSSYRPPTSTY
jgi:hypothetical protein